MKLGRRHDRRGSKLTNLNIRRSFLFHVPRPLAAVIVALAVAAIAIAEILVSRVDGNIWLGPIYLVPITFAAWSLGSRPAIALGFLIVASHWATNSLYQYSPGGGDGIWNLAMRFLAILVVIGMLDIARRALEQEWLLARTDLLTGALNRQAFFETVASQVEEEGWYLLIYADLDGLKQLNDHQGHALGDQGLKSFAEGVKKSIRKGDLFARIGGDEFAICMRVRDEEAGHMVARRLNRTINAPDRQGDVSGLSCSLGALILPPGPRSIDTELKLADELMYGAKQAGTGLSAATACRRSGVICLPLPAGQEITGGKSQILRATERQA